MPGPIVYLDNAASTPLREGVFEAMEPFLKEEFGNASSLHPMGQAARAAVERARSQVAALCGAQASEIVFTSGASEANNLAIRGVIEPLLETGQPVHAVTTALEHPSVAETFAALKKQGLSLTVVAPSPDGIVDAETVLAAVRPETALVSIMAVNNEIGTIQPVAAIAAGLKRLSPRPPLHVDAVQAASSTVLDRDALGADLLALSAHKIGGPKGIGALIVRRGSKLRPILTGGRQEQALRAGTENVAGIAGFGAAAERLKMGLEAERRAYGALAGRLRDGLARLGGPKPLLPPTVPTAPHILSIECPGAEADFLVLVMGREGVMVSAGSACSSGTREASAVLLAMGLPERRAGSVIRVSFGFHNDEKDVDRFLDVLASATRKSGR